MSIRSHLSALAVLAAALLPITASPSSAQFGPGPGGRAPYAQEPSPRNEAGRFDYYALVMSWSPSHCAGLRRDGYDPQCHSRDGKQYSFVLHGLWPQHDRGWPQNCPIQGRPFVPQKVIDGMLDIMPSSRLVIHEYRKHGTCSGLSPEDYYKVSRDLFAKVRVPPRYEGPNQAFTVSPTEVIRDFLSVNPTMKAENIAVGCGGPGNRLREVRVCYSREGEFKACGRNEDARRMCSSNRISVPPVRGGGGEPGFQRRPSRDERRI